MQIRSAAVPGGLTITIADSGTGTVLFRVMVEPGEPRSYHGLMAPSLRRAEGRDAPIGNPIAGRIEAAPKPLEQAVAAWRDHMASLGHSPKTVQAYAGVVLAAAEELVISHPVDFSHAAVTDYMARKRADGGWSGTTYNRNLSAFRSFTRFLQRRQLIQSDPLADADRARDDGEEGARAATTEEARLLIRRAWACELADGRAKSPRALIRMCQFLMALRVGEASRLQWRHLDLDSELPRVIWTKDINKNRRHQEIALAPELVPLLRQHRETMREWAKTKRVYQPPKRRGRRPSPRAISPEDPKAYVFPVAQGKHTWNQDAESAGITRVDPRGRAFTPHSARKWFSTTLALAGVNQGVIDALMRHHAGTSARYQDLPPMRDVMERLPRLWPETANVDNSCTTTVNVEKSGLDLTTRAEDVDDLPATPSLTESSHEPPAPAPDGVATQVWARGSCDFGLGSKTWSLVFPGHAEPVMPRGGLETKDSTPPSADEQDRAIEDLLDALTRLLRSRRHAKRSG